MKTLLAFLFTLGLLAAASYLAMDKGYLVNPFTFRPLEEKSVLDTLVKDVNAQRDHSTRPPLSADDALEAWLDKQAGSMSSHQSGVKVLLNRLQTMEPSVASASAQFISSNQPDALQKSLTEWASQLSGEETNVAVHVFAQNAMQPYRAIAVAAERLPKFSPLLLGLENDGRPQRFYNVCPNCNKPHVSTVTRESLAVALECPSCDGPYDLYAMRLDGSYCRVNDLLTGYHRASDFPDGMSKFDQMMAIWRTVLKEFVYTSDLQGSGGAQDSWQTAAETSKIGNGDCEDTSIFMADWLISRGIDARVAIGKHVSGGGHAWCVAAIEGTEYLLETTAGTDCDVSKPPLVSRCGYEYVPLAMFDREATYFREGELPASGQYFTSAGWLKVAQPLKDPAREHAPPYRPSMRNMALSAGLFGLDRVPDDGQ